MLDAGVAVAHEFSIFVMDEVRDDPLPGIVGFCAPVFDSDGHMVLGMITLGPAANLDARWDGSVHRPLAAAAARLSSDLGYGGSNAA